VSLAARVGDELADFLRVALLWFGLSPAIRPLGDVVAAVPGVPTAPWWLSAAVAAVVVGWVNYAHPNASLLRVWLFGLLAALFYVVARALSTSAAPAGGGSWRLVAVLAGCWVCAFASALAITSRRARRELYDLVDPVARGRSD
jgi:hypothetical protein